MMTERRPAMTAVAAFSGTTSCKARVGSFVVGMRLGYQPKHRTGHDCLAVQVQETIPEPVWTFAQNAANALALAST
jgi:hypothetical protein